MVTKDEKKPEGTLKGTSEPKSNSTNQTDFQSAKQSVVGFFSSPGAKFILIGMITIALLIPALMVWALVEDRSRRADEVARSISKGWGGEQVINGPYLVVPYRIHERVNNSNRTQQVTRHTIISAKSLEMSGDINVEERKLSIYKTQLYHLKTGIKGSFDKTDLQPIIDKGGVPQLKNAYLALGVSDMSGFRSDVDISINGGKSRRFLAGLRDVTSNVYLPSYGRKVGGNSGVHLPISEGELNDGFSFTFDLALNGSRDLILVPAGSTSKFNLKSNWPHPGFGGKFLPEQREVSKDGFNANWTIPDLARGISQIRFESSLPTANSSIQVNFVEPLKFYQVVERTLKYSIAFFSLIFLAVFILELIGKNPVHWIQYVLVGLAMVIFYILLLALAEQIGFTLAYLSSSAATTLLVAWYIGDSIGSQRSSIVMGAVLAVTYLVMYLILNEEDYALLAGSIVAFAAIATTMVTTRKIDWSARRTANA